jgi:outer membrane protein OmpA-like peptidoglycan-associated protein
MCIVVFALLLLHLPALASAQEFRWFDSFFLESSVQRDFAAEILDKLVRPEVGFRGALGYEYRGFRFAVESGYTAIAGTNPLVLDVSLAPLVFKFGYALPIRWGLGLQADFNAGFMFSRTTHYETAIDILMDNKKNSQTRSPLAGARLYATYTLPKNFLRIYAGGGIDALFENSGPIPMPLIEAGASFKPLALVRPRAAWQAAQSEAASAETTEEMVVAPEDLVFSHTPENIVVEKNERGRTVRLLNAVYFEANNANMIERYRPILDEAGRRLRSGPGLRITLKGYAAPFGTVEGRAALSEARARYCMDYLKRRFGIAEARMAIEYYGAERSPEFVDATWESYRCVELIIGE